VWDGEPTEQAPHPEGTGGPGWMLFVPPGTLHHGPQGRGAVLWTHGRGGEPASPQARMPHPFVQRFNNAGFDVWLLLREPRADRNYDRVLSFADETLRAAAQWLRAEQGYERVIAAGQSAGGWAALAALDTPGLLDGAIVVAGAGYYVAPDGRRNLLDFDALLARVRDPDAPIVAVMFQGDPLLPDPGRSAAAMRRALGWRTGPLLVIDRPAGLTGHGAGVAPAFNDRFGECLLRLIAEGEAARCRAEGVPPT
jgi:alpha-beta hydrolase superfamily lysophospholipase